MEIGNKGFEIQRSGKNRKWETLGFIEGKGSVYESQFYQFSDKSPLIGTNNYRLKQIDFDGQFEYSHVAGADFYDKKREIILSPNPVINNKVSVVLPPFETSIERFQIFNMLGNLVLEKETETSKFVIDLNDFSEGMYLLKFQTMIAMFLVN